MKWFRNTIFYKAYKYRSKNTNSRYVDESMLMTEGIKEKYHLLKQLLINEFHGKKPMSNEEMKEIIDYALEVVQFNDVEMEKFKIETPSALVSFYVKDEHNIDKYQIQFTISSGTKGYGSRIPIHYMSESEFSLFNMSLKASAEKIMDYMLKEFNGYINKLIMNPNAHVKQDSYRPTDSSKLKLQPLKEVKDDYNDYLEIEFDKYISSYKTSTKDYILKINSLYDKLIAIKLIHQHLNTPIKYGSDLEKFLEEEPLSSYFTYHEESEEEEIDYSTFDGDKDNEEEVEEFEYNYEKEYYEWKVWCEM